MGRCVAGMVQLFTDELGWGARWNNHLFRFQWPGDWGGRNIMLKEILPVGIWGHLWVGLSVVTHVDNEAAVAILDSGYSKEGQIMHLVRT